MLGEEAEPDWVQFQSFVFVHRVLLRVDVECFLDSPLQTVTFAIDHFHIVEINAVAQTICCWWTCGFAWWLWFPSKNHHWYLWSVLLLCVLDIKWLKFGCLGYCPHSFLHCFKALGLPKSAERQIKSEAFKTALRSPYVHFLRRGTWRGSVLHWTLFTSFCIFVLYFFIVFSICFAISVSHPTQLIPFPSIHATISLFDFSNCQAYTVFGAYSSFLRASFGNKSPSSPSVALCLLFVTWNQRCAGRPLVDLSF